MSPAHTSVSAPVTDLAGRHQPDEAGSNGARNLARLVRLYCQHSAGADHQAPDFVGLDVDLVGLRRLARKPDRVFVFAGSNIERRAVGCFGPDPGADLDRLV